MESSGSILNRPLLYMFLGNLHQLPDMIVLEGVENRLPLPAVANQPGLTENLELMGDGGLGRSNENGDITDAQLGGEEGVDDLHPGRIPQDLEDVSQILELFRVRGGFPDPVDHVRMYQEMLALGGTIGHGSILTRRPGRDKDPPPQERIPPLDPLFPSIYIRYEEFTMMHGGMMPSFLPILPGGIGIVVLGVLIWGGIHLFRSRNHIPRNHIPGNPRSSQPGGKKRLTESSVYQLAAEMGGRLTASDLVIHYSVDGKRGEQFLKDISDGSRVDMEVQEDGSLIFLFREIIKRREGSL